MTPNERADKNRNDKYFNLSSWSTHPGSSFASFNRHDRSFTLIELLVVLALVAILSVVVVMTLNPAELLKQARDSNRLSDLSTINTALNLFSADVTSGFMGTSTVVYVSIPDNSSSTCGSLGLPALPSGYTYNCVTATNLRNTNGTGWIPVNFQRISSNSPISQLPIDPQNTTSTRYYTYVTGGSWKVSASAESQKYKVTASTDGGINVGQFEAGNDMSLAPFLDGLIGWWKFDEGPNATSTDYSGYGKHGTWNGTSTAEEHYVVGKVGAYAGSFNGVNDYISTTATMSATAHTASFWVYLDRSSSKGAGQIIFWSSPSDRAGMLLMEKSGTFWTYNYNKSGNASHNIGYMPGSCPDYIQYSCGGSVAINQWRHIAVSRQGTVEEIYIDGILSATRVFSSNGGYYNQVRFSWTQWGSYQDFFGGKLDDIKIYNRALSAPEVLAIYNSTK